MQATQPIDAAALPGGMTLQKYADALQRQESRYWYLLAAVCILTTVGLAFAIVPLLDQRAGRWWPWANTELVLIVGLSVSTMLLVTYMSLRKRKAADLRLRTQRVIEDVERRQRQNRARLQALLHVSQVMGSLTTLEGLFESITKTCVELFGCQQASLMLVDTDRRALEVRAATGHARENLVGNVTLKIGEGIAGWVAQTQTPLILNSDTDASRYPGLQLRDPSIMAAMVVPIVLRGELVGVLNVSSRVADARYDDDDLHALLVFAENAGTCVRHTEHVEWMRKTLHEFMEGGAKRRKGEDVRVS